MSYLGCKLAPLLLAGASLLPRPARAEAQEPVLVATAQWQKKAAKDVLVVALDEALTTKQKNIINGGFTTVSQLLIKKLGEGDGANSTKGAYKVSCSVKFDAWEETYDVARLDETPRTALVRRLADYGELCLKAEISDTSLLQPLMNSGGTLEGILSVKQMSLEEASKIKDWLIQQQSGVMQSLFSHMLGELTLNQTAQVRISVPAKPHDKDKHSGPVLRFGKTPAAVPATPL